MEDGLPKGPDRIQGLLEDGVGILDERWMREESINEQRVHGMLLLAVAST